MSLLLHLLNGLAFGLLLFLLAGGLTVIFGQMRVVNLSHGALYLLGAYLGLTVQRATGSFLLAAVAAPLAVGALALVIDRALGRRLYSSPLNQVLLTLGLGFLIGDLLLAVYGGNPQTLSAPAALQGGADLGGMVFPRYRLAIIVVGLLYAALLWAVWTRTRLGAVLRAGVDDAEMLDALGIRVSRLFGATFVGGAALAALAGVLGGPFLGVATGLDLEVLLLSLVVVVIGGLGSLYGAFAASLLVGVLDALSKAYVPELSYFAVFAPVIVVLAVRPQGLFGRAVTA